MLVTWVMTVMFVAVGIGVTLIVAPWSQPADARVTSWAVLGVVWAVLGTVIACGWWTALSSR